MTSPLPARRRSPLLVIVTVALLALVLAPTLAATASATTTYSLLIADNMNRRLLITDFNGNIQWVMNNPTGGTSSYDGPLGVRWLGNNQILATFGTGQVGIIDVTTKQLVWQTSGYNGNYFQSPYDAEILPDGNLAVALRYNAGGECQIYNRSTGAVVWTYLLSNAHVVRYEPSSVAYNSPTYPAILCGGWGQVAEANYAPGTSVNQKVTWSVPTEYTHEALHVESGYMVKSEGYYINKIDRNDNQIWKISTPDEERRVAVNPYGGYIFTVLLGDRVEFRGLDGHLISQWSKLSDGTTLYYPYGIAVIPDFSPNPSPSPTTTPTSSPTTTPTPTASPTPTPSTSPTPTPSGGSTTLFSDGFESGGFGNWTTVGQGGDGSATVQSSVKYAGTYAARFSETTNSGSYADARKTLSSTQTSLTASAAFDVTAEGPSGTNVPLFRLLTSSERLLTLYRQNATGGQIWLTYGGTYYKTSGILGLGTWGTLSVKVDVNGTSSSVTVTQNGSTTYTATASLGTTGVSSIQIGDDTAAQGGTVYVDNVNVTNP